MTRSDEIWTWCLKVIKRPPCDNILASNLPLRPAPSARHRSIGICLLSLSSYPESRPCMWLQISTTWLKKQAQINAKYFCHLQAKCMLSSENSEICILVLCKLVFILSFETYFPMCHLSIIYLIFSK